MYHNLNLALYAPIYRRLSLKPQTGRIFCSSEVQVHKALYLLPDGSIVINAIMCKVMTLFFHMHINWRLYIVLQTTAQHSLQTFVDTNSWPR